MFNKKQNVYRKSQNFLEEIVQIKKMDLLKKTRNTQEISSSKFLNVRKSEKTKFRNLFNKEGKNIKLIAEIKFASPTSPNLGSPEELLKRVKAYRKAGADAISLITEKHFFKGDVQFVSLIKKQETMSVLQKDFVIDPSQIFEAKEIGSDALLLIARLVDIKTLQKFVDLSFELGIEPVVEIANEEDLAKAVETKTNIIAVNARDLETFEISVETACLLMQKIPDRFLKLGFSGIQSAKEVSLYKKAGANGILVGTSLMKANDIEGLIRSLVL